MADNDGTAPLSVRGQAPAPVETTEGHAETSEQTSPETVETPSTPAPAETVEDLDFYDPKLFEEQVSALPPELQAQARGLRKQLLGDYTKKTQGIAAQKQKLAMVEAFERDPVGVLQQVAQQQGYTLTRAEARAAVETVSDADNTPGTWDEVYSRAEQRVFAKLAPFLDTVRKEVASKLETELDGIDPEWRTYEAEMMELAKEAPALAKNPRRLYRAVVPEEVIESRAMAKALDKLRKTTSAASGAGQSTTRKSTPAIKQADTIWEAYEQAKAGLVSGKG